MKNSIANAKLRLHPVRLLVVFDRVSADRDETTIRTDDEIYIETVPYFKRVRLPLDQEE